MASDAYDSDDLERRVAEIASGTPYPLEAFQLVLRAMPSLFYPAERWDHITGAEFCWRLRDRAVFEFGPKALETLRSWSVETCDDFGNIVYTLVDAGLIGKSEQDSKSDFHGVYDFDKAFHPDPAPQKTPARIQWRISTLFWITTLAAIALAGFGRLGVYGAVGTIFSSWIGLIGAVLLVDALMTRSKGWILAACVGIGLFGIAIAIFVGITFDP